MASVVRVADCGGIVLVGLDSRLPKSINSRITTYTDADTSTYH